MKTYIRLRAFFSAATNCAFLIIWLSVNATMAPAQTNTFPGSGNAGIGTTTPTYPLTILKDQNGPTVAAIFNTSDGATAQVGSAASRTLDFSTKYISWGVTAPSFSSPGYGETAYFHSAGVPLKFGSNTNNDIFFFTNGITNTRMMISASGNVGVGTTSPLALFDVRNSDGFFYAGFGYGASKETFLRAGNSSNGVMHIGDLNTSKTLLQENGGNVGIGTTNPTNKLHVAGSITVDGNINAKYQDFAEWVPSTQALSPATVVVLDPTKTNEVVTSSQAYDTRVAGVVSAQPGIALGERGPGKILVATTGRVRVKVDASREPIQVGDLLVTSDVPGVAMKSKPVNVSGVQLHRPGTLIGKALEPLARGKGEILVLLSLQ